MTANTEIYDKVIDRAAMIRLYERRVNGKVSVILDGHEVKIERLIRDAQTSPQGLDALRRAVEMTTKETYADIYQTSKRSLLDLARDQLSYTYQGVEASIGKIWNPERPAKVVAEDIVLKRPLYGDSTLNAGWANVGTGEKKRLEAIIRKGIAENSTVDEIALAVRKNNVHTITRAQSKALVVTAVTSVTAQADHEVYSANEKVLAGWQYVAVLDARTTSLCAHRNGKVYPIKDRSHLPPAHFHCRSTTVPVFKRWDDIANLEGLSRIRTNNLKNLTAKEKAFYDGETHMDEAYDAWLTRQPKEVQLRHLGDYKRVELFNSGDLTVSGFSNPEGNTLGINDLRKITDSGYTLPNDTRRFAAAKAKLDAMNLGASTPDDFIFDKRLTDTLRDYYELQTKELDGTLSLTNYRGMLLGTKKSTRRRVLTSPPREEQMIFNPINGRYEDIRLYQPNPGVYSNNLRLVAESTALLDKDKAYIKSFVESLEDRMSMNERAVVTDNLRIMFTRYRTNGEVWGNFKAVAQGQIKFDVMNVSDAIETQLRRDSDVFKKLRQSSYIDSVLGPTELQSLHDNFLKNVKSKNNWEDAVAPKIAKELRQVFDRTILKSHPIIASRLSDSDLQQFYLRFAHRLGMADTPDKDQFAMGLGRDLYNLANLNGDRTSWFKLGTELLNTKNAKKFYELETYGVQKRRMKSRMSGQYFGPYYDTLSHNIRVTDKRIQDYAQLSRKVELGLRVAVTDEKNVLTIREGYKTYFSKGALGYYDTRIPITSTSSFSDFPVEFIDKNLVDALNWAGKTKYKVDNDFHDFIEKLLYFEDDKGKAKHYNELNEYRKYIASRGDAYERFKSMQWLRSKDAAFSNHPFIDHRARIYDRGLISPQSGESFRPFLNTAVPQAFSKEGFLNLQDQVGAFLGGLDDYFEGRHNSLTMPGRQKIAEQWRQELVTVGNHMIKAKPNDIRAVLENKMVQQVDGEEQGKLLRFAIELAKIDNHLKGDYSTKGINTLKDYKIALALEQDASSSGAQIIALTTRNKQLAEMSNVVATNQKRRLYDEIANATYNDPRFRELNKKLGLNEKDLRKAAKAQNMVTLYGAGERTGIFNVEGKLAKVLEKDVNTLVVRAADRDIVLDEISARMARYQKFDPVTTEELRVLRQNIKDVFNKGTSPADDLIDQLYFLDPKTKELVEKMSKSYGRVVTPDDFKQVANIMSEHLAAEVPILQNFTKFFGRLAEDFLKSAKPSQSDFDWEVIAKAKMLGNRKKGYSFPDPVNRLLGIKPGEAFSENTLKRFGSWKPNGTLADIIYGVETPKARRTGMKVLKYDIAGVIDISEIEILQANKLPKSWTNVPWVNFDGKIVEQNFTQKFEEKLRYKDANGNWFTNIVQVPQKTEATWWEQVINKSGKINDIADVTKARTAYAVNGNHSNDAVIVKKFHMWGKEANVPTSTIHDAFFANAADMVKARKALRNIYAETLENNVVLMTLDEMKARGLPQELYDKYLSEAIDNGLVPVAGRSKINGKVMKASDILTIEDILEEIPYDFKSNRGWYGVG